VYVPIIGIANAGKSSLLNVILGFGRAIVYHEAGTTRDAITEEFIINGEKIIIIDTAGINETLNEVERIGIIKAKEYLGASEIVLWVTPAEQKIQQREIELINKNAHKTILGIISKSDLSDGKEKQDFCEQNNIPYIRVCLLDECSRETVVQFLSTYIDRVLKNGDGHSIICNLRQEEALKSIKDELAIIDEAITTENEEMVVYRLRKTMELIAEFVGETTTEEILDSIFSKFCIGK
jgi:tRNA modification GTPase